MTPVRRRYNRQIFQAAIKNGMICGHGCDWRSDCEGNRRVGHPEFDRSHRKGLAVRRFLLLIVIVTFTVAIFGPILRGYGQPPASKAPAARPLSDLEKLMQKKLEYAQKLLGGIALNDLEQVQHNARELLTLSKTAEFRVLKTPAYELHSNEFRRSLEEIVKGAKDRNIDSATLGYVDMTLACVRCHKHVREVRVTHLPQKLEFGQNLRIVAGR